MMSVLSVQIRGPISPACQAKFHRNAFFPPTLFLSYLHTFPFLLVERGTMVIDAELQLHVPCMACKSSSQFIFSSDCTQTSWTAQCTWLYHLSNK